MGKPRRLTKKLIQDDIDSYAALIAVRTYRPSNTAYELEAVAASQTAMVTDQTDEIQKDAAADAAQDKAENSEHAFHNLILGAKSQVKAQFGENSDEYASLGLKKKIEYKSGRRRAAKNKTQPI